MNARQYKKLKVEFNLSGPMIVSGARAEKNNRKSWRKLRHLYVVHGFNIHGRRHRQCAKALRDRFRKELHAAERRDLLNEQFTV